MDGLPEGSRPTAQQMYGMLGGGMDSPSGSNGAANLMNGLSMEDVDEVVPMARDRCNTWPLRRPTMELSAPSNMIHEEIPEESSIYDSNEQLTLSDSSNPTPTGADLCSFSPSVASPDVLHCLFSPSPSLDGTPKKGATRRNAWGNMSYADLITQAILSSPEKRLTLSQVYEWMVNNVAYFRDKGDSNSSAGWKNSIRHNLSLHSRFMRIQNEGAGKSSWWVINPDAKPGRNPRRQRASTMDTTTKAVMEKKRRGARKKVMELRAGSTSALSVSSGVGSSSNSVLSHDVYPQGEDSLGGFGEIYGRARAASTSLVGARSPAGMDALVAGLGAPIQEDFDFPPWVGSHGDSGVAIPSDILDRTDQMSIGGRLIGREIKQEPKAIKQEPGTSPLYQELSSVRSSSTSLTNPILRGQLSGIKPPPGMSSYLTGYGWGGGMPQQTCSVASQVISTPSSLPIDLENLTLPDQPLMDMDMESILRHELSQPNNQLNFDLNFEQLNN